jgi:TolB protein
VRARAWCALAALLACLVVAGPAAATFRGDNGRISFSRLAEDNGVFWRDIFTVDSRGSNPFRVTAFGPETFTFFSDWSPDGRTLAVDSEQGGPPQVWLVDPDGSDARQLTAFENGAFDPAWSPDGRTLATDGPLDGGEGIHLIPARTRRGELNTGDKARRVTLVTDGGYDSESQFSPDGKWIVFTRYSVECTDEATFENCSTRIFRVRTNGTRLQQLTGPELNASAPDYHPSGRYIAFDTSDNFVVRDAGHIMVMDDDGSDKRVLVRGDADDFFGNPSFSPDGRQVAFTHWPIGADGETTTSEVWTARADGRHAKLLAAGANFDNKPDWGPAPRHHHGDRD